MTLQPIAAKGGTTWQATVRITSSAGIVVPFHAVRGRFVHFINGEVEGVTLSDPMQTDVAGYATFSTFFAGQNPGDNTEFIIPQLIDDGTGVLIIPVGPIYPAAPEFMWAESSARSVMATR